MTGVDYSTNQITRELIRVDKMTFSPDGSLTQSSSQRIYKVLCDDGGRYEADADKYDVEKGNAACVAAWREYVRSHEQESPWNPQVAALVAERQKGYKKKQARSFEFTLNVPKPQGSAVNVSLPAPAPPSNNSSSSLQWPADHQPVLSKNQVEFERLKALHPKMGWSKRWEMAVRNVALKHNASSRANRRRSRTSE